MLTGGRKPLLKRRRRGYPSPCPSSASIPEWIRTTNLRLWSRWRRLASADAITNNAIVYDFEGSMQGSARLPSLAAVCTIRAVEVSDPNAMFNQTLSVLLATSILSCPWLCSGGEICARSSERSAACGCCHSESSNSSHKQDSSPAKESSTECQGICGGAVVVDTAMPDIDLDINRSLPVMDHSSLLASSESSDGHLLIAAWPDIGANIGRLLCCLYSTLLC
jgi:hypothetical protein